MAREALTRLSDEDGTAVVGPNPPIDLAGIAERLRGQISPLGIERITVTGAREVLVPARAARALVLAAAQAASNAVAHADGVGLNVRIAEAPGGVRIVVSDEGPGFDVSAIPADRLGIRGSIIARVAAVGGSARVTSSPSGTSVELAYTVPHVVEGDRAEIAPADGSAEGETAS
nr:ATP-binding protein [Microbacterium amylolyticum]